MEDKRGELLQQYSSLVRNGEGSEYTVQSWARRKADGDWEGWLEYHPLEDDKRIRKTPAEVSRPGRGDLTHWAAALELGYLEDAFARAK